MSFPATATSFFTVPALTKRAAHAWLCCCTARASGASGLCREESMPGGSAITRRKCALWWRASRQPMRPLRNQMHDHEPPKATMAKPVIWTVDDDPDVLRAVERDLRRHYGDRYRIISADSAVSALEATKQLKLRNEPVALFLVDQRMPRMSGVEFLEEAIELYPDAKRALLTAYADTDAAIRAINGAHIDHYLMKPWDPPEERLYGVVDDMLDDWQSSYHPTFEGVRVIGTQWSPHSTEVRDFLGRNFVPHRWLNVETDDEAKKLLTSTGADASALPLVVFPDGSFVNNPPTSEVARKLGLRT